MTMGDEKMLSVLRTFAVEFEELLNGEREAITNLKAALYDKEKEMSANRLNWIPLNEAYPKLHQEDPKDFMCETSRYLISNEVLGMTSDGHVRVVKFEPECTIERFGYWTTSSCEQADVVAWMELPDTRSFSQNDRDKADRMIEAIWDALEDVPMDPKTECIEEWFWRFKAGTHREVIWEWFDENHSKGVHWLLYERKRT